MERGLELVEALQALGGRAHLDDITLAVIKARRARGKKIPPNIAASVRNGLQRHCSLSPAYCKHDDLFRPSGNDDGFWKLLNYKPKEKTMTIPQKSPTAGDIMEQVILKGDIGKLTPDERVQYYNAVCKSIGLNPLTRPLEYMTLQGKQVLYCRKDGADQLRKINGISVQIVSQEMSDGLLTVHVKARDRDGREDEDLGAVPFPETLRGDVRANTILKCVTKAKRRVTLSISGLGFLDETEVESIPGAKTPPAPAPNVMLPPHDPQTGEIIQSAVADEEAPPSLAPIAADVAPSANSSAGGAALSIEDQARAKAKQGDIEFRTFWRNLGDAEQARVHEIGDELRTILDAVPKQE